MWRKIGLIFVSFLFSIVFVLWLIIINLRFVLLSPATYTQELSQMKFGELALEIAPTSLYNALVSSNPEVITLIPEDQFTAIVKEAIPQSYLDNSITAIVNSLITFLNGQKSDITYTLDLTTPKQTITQKLGPVIYETMTHSICKQVDLTGADCTGFLEKNQLTQTKILELPEFQQILSQIPDSISFSSAPLKESNQSIASLYQLRSYLLLIINQGLIISSFVTVLLLVSLWLLALNWSGKLKAIGWNLFSVSFLPLISFILMWWQHQRLLSLVLNSFGHQLTQTMLNSIGMRLSIIYQDLCRLMVIEFGVLWIMSLILILVAVFVKRQEKITYEQQLIQRVQQSD